MKFLFRFLYNGGIVFYRLGIEIASLWNPKAKQWIEGRKNLFKKIQSQVKPDEYRVWFHCASVGEFEQGRTVIEAYRKKFPAHKIVITFYSPSGFELRKKYSGADYVFYMPLDTRRNAEKFVSLINPRLVVFVKYEFWFHFLNELRRKQIPCIMISAIFREGHLLFNSFAGPLQEVAKSFKKIFVQDEDSFNLLRQHGFTNAALASDTRFDRVWQIAESPRHLPIIEQFKAGKKLLVAGSTWPEDEKLLLKLLAEENNQWKWIFVPHEIDDSHITELRTKIPAALYSELEAGKSLSNANVLIIDQVGFLSSIYQFADMAYIGGGFGAGIHNTLEAAVYGIPVLFGPNYQKFNEAKKLVETGGAKSVSNYSELKDAFEFYQRSENKSVGKLNRSWVQQQTGGTEKIMKYVESIISDSGASPV